MDDKEIPKGYKCSGCGEWHEFAMYVFAHWSEELKHVCPKCGTRHSIYQGEATKDE